LKDASLENITVSIINSFQNLVLDVSFAKGSVQVFVKALFEQWSTSQYITNDEQVQRKVIVVFGRCLDGKSETTSVQMLRRESRVDVRGSNKLISIWQAFLSKEMVYSCPVWGPDQGGIRGDLEGHRKPGDLEGAQDQKIKMLLAKARVRPGDRILEIGCGWGGLESSTLGC